MVKKKREIKRKEKPKLHFFFPEASKTGERINVCEAFYIDFVLSDYIRKKKWIRQFYAESDSDKFIKALKEKGVSDDIYYIVLDTDFSVNDAVDQLTKKIRDRTLPFIKLAEDSNKELKIILSSRAFETYLCFYNNSYYTKPYSDMSTLYKDIKFENYKKKREWYDENKKDLKIDLNDFISRIVKARHKVFNDAKSPIKNYDNPDYSSDLELNFLCMNAPYTYFDLLLNDLI